MFSDLKGECQRRILAYFPERQIYLRTNSEVKYYHLSTRAQASIAALLAFMAAWCLLTITSVIWGHNPLSSSVKDLRLQEANFERAMAEEKAKLQNTQLMLVQQKESFEKIARNFEQKKIVMSPHIRDPYPRTSRRSFISSEPDSQTQVDRFLINLGDSQNTVLKAAELDMLNEIERKRAIIRATNIDLEDVLEASPFGKGGPTSTSDDSANFTSTSFLPRMESVKARITESSALDAAIHAMPVGHPIDDDNYKTSRYGMRPDPFTKRPTFHAGLDYGSFKNARIVAAAGGVVTRSGRNGGMGNMVEIDHGHGFKSRYGHLNRLNVKRGQKVERGQLIGGMGSTGRSTSTHLHYEVYFQGRTVDPSRFVKAGQYVQ